MKKLIPLAVVALVTGCSSAPKDVYLSCMPDKVEITTVGGVDPGKEQGDPKDYDFLLRFNIDEQTANEGSDKYAIDESENELRFDLENPEDDGSNYIIVNRKDLSTKGAECLARSIKMATPCSSMTMVPARRLTSRLLQIIKSEAVFGLPF